MHFKVPFGKKTIILNNSSSETHSFELLGQDTFLSFFSEGLELKNDLVDLKNLAETQLIGFNFWCLFTFLFFKNTPFILFGFGHV